MTKFTLIGFMGSGKTTLGQHLAHSYQLQWLDLDQFIERQIRTTIPEIFQKHGERHFRMLESHFLQLLLQQQQPDILSLGGGTVKNHNNINLLHTHNYRFIYLKTSFSELQRRLAQDHSRPLFQDPQQAEKLFQQRLPLYERYADITIDTDNKTIEEIASLLSIKTELSLPYPINSNQHLKKR